MEVSIPVPEEVRFMLGRAIASGKYLVTITRVQDQKVLTDFYGSEGFPLGDCQKAVEHASENIFKFEQQHKAGGRHPLLARKPQKKD